MSIFTKLLDLLFPPKCPFCKKVLDRAELCPDCEKSLPWTAEPDTVQTLPGGVSCAAPLFYEAAVRDALLRLKFRGGTHLAAPLGELIARCAAEQFSGEFDVVAWAPVGPKRLKQRGYDQARLLAQAACRMWGSAPERLLEKPRDNPAQSGLDGAAARRANVLGAYEIAPGAAVEGRRVLLIDDVCTTGSTLGECARTLLDAGAKSVVCAAAARTRPLKNVRKTA